MTVRIRLLGWVSIEQDGQEPHHGRRYGAGAAVHPRSRRRRLQGVDYNGLTAVLLEAVKALRQEFETGQKMLADLEAQRRELQRTLLRIGGAIQVLEELIADTEASGPDPAAGAVNHVVEGTAVKAADRADRSVDQATGADQSRAEPVLGKRLP